MQNICDTIVQYKNNWENQIMLKEMLPNISEISSKRAVFSKTI